MALKTRPLDVAELLENEDDILSFLNEAAATGDDGFFIHALNTAARAVGMTEVAKKAGITRSGLYKALSKNGNPGFATISKITKALGVNLAVQEINA